MGTEVVITDANKNNALGQITITSPHEGVIVRCNKVVKSQKFKGGKASPKHALFAQDQTERSFWGATSTFLGWYMTEESVMKEMEEIRQALFCGSDMYEMKYSVKTRKTFLSVKAV